LHPLCNEKIKMKKTSTTALILITMLLMSSCGIYSLSGAKIDAETIQVDYFPNVANLVEPSASQKFTLALQDLFLQQSSLDLVKSGGDLEFQGEIVDYKIRPTSATADQTASYNRLTITVNVRFYNHDSEEDNFEKKFSHFYDFKANTQLSGGTLDEAFQVIFGRITQDVFNESVAKW